MGLSDVTLDKMIDGDCPQCVMSAKEIGELREAIAEEQKVATGTLKGRDEQAELLRALLDEQDPQGLAERVHKMSEQKLYEMRKRAEDADKSAKRLSAALLTAASDNAALISACNKCDRSIKQLLDSDEPTPAKYWADVRLARNSARKAAIDATKSA